MAEDTGRGRTLVTWTAPHPPAPNGYRVVVPEAKINESRKNSPFGYIFPAGLYTIQVYSLFQHYLSDRRSVQLTIMGKGTQLGDYS